MCEKWFHAGCLKIPNKVYKVLGQITNLHWFCEVCNGSVHKVLVAVGKMQEKMDNMEERMSSHQKETESEIRKVSARQVNFELEMARLKETIDKEFVEVHINMQAVKKEMEEAASRSKTLTDQGVIDVARAEVAVAGIDTA